MDCKDMTLVCVCVWSVASNAKSKEKKEVLVASNNESKVT